MAPPKKVLAPIVPGAPKAIDKKALIAAQLVKINKSVGEGTVGTLTDKKDELQLRLILTRSPTINTALAGGVAYGKLSEWYGPPDSGKTSIILDTIGYNMQIDPDFYAGWYETEGHFDMDYAVKMFGIDPDRLSIWHMTDNGAEKGLDVLESLLRTGAFNMMVVNTVAGLTPAKELTDDMGDNNIGLQARMVSKLMRKIVAVAATRGTHVAFVNQVRVDINAFKGGTTPTGGKALAYWASQRVELRGGFIDDTDKQRGYDPELHKKIDVKIKKNRICTNTNPYKKCTYFVEYGFGIDVVGELPGLCLDAGILTRGGSWYTYPDATGKPIVLQDGTLAKWQGIGGLRLFLRDNDWFAAELRKRLETLGVKAIVVQTMTEAEVEEALIEEAVLTQDLAEEE